jgi:hypothetical protein
MLERQSPREGSMFVVLYGSFFPREDSRRGGTTSPSFGTSRRSSEPIRTHYGPLLGTLYAIRQRLAAWVHGPIERRYCNPDS